MATCQSRGEYELQEIRDAIVAARHRGADVRIVYHAKRGDEQAEINEGREYHEMWRSVQQRDPG